jgi:ABC-type lipoprotein release transport system permease subunit
MFNSLIPTSVRLGFYLAYRQILRSNPWSTGLIVLVMVLTFLNLVVVSGILVGLIQGSIDANKKGYVGDAILTPLGDKKYIENSQFLVELATSNPRVESVAGRYLTSGSVESGYKAVTNANDRQLANAQVIGIDPATETADYKNYIKEGRGLEVGDYDKVILGANLIDRYLGFDIPGFKTLKNVYPGTKVRIRVGGTTRDMTVVGILKRKVDEFDRAIIMTSAQFKDLSPVNEFAVISVTLKPGESDERFKNELIVSGAGRYADVNTFLEGVPKAVLDIRDTFAILGNAISSIGLVVAAITIFIVIFINALTRRKFIGIMKGIGISGRTIEISYVFQSMFYALIGSAFGLALLYGFLVPFFEKNPIDFPFSDGILVADLVGTMTRVSILIFVTFIAGYIPAWMIVRRNTLNSILGR